MKRLISMSVLAVMFFCLLAVPAFAAGGPSAADITSLHLDEDIQLPEEGSYLSSYEDMFVTSNAGIYSYTQAGKSKVIETIDRGSKVTLIAVQKSFACVLYDGKNGRSAGWIGLEFLNYNNPLNKLSPVKAKSYSGTPGPSDITAVMPENRISMPEDNQYISSYDRMYIITDLTMVFSSLENTSNYACRLAVGSEVTVIALNKHLACILYETDSGTKAGWVYRDTLRYNSPDNKRPVVSAPDHSGVPDANTVVALGLDKSIKMPDEDSYISSYDRMYVVMDTLAVLVYDETGKSHTVCTLYSGSQVRIIAIQNMQACILFNTDEGEKAGWVVLEGLGYNLKDGNKRLVKAKTYAGRPGVSDLKELGLDKSMTLPNSDSYISFHDKRYVTPSAVQVFSFNEKKKTNTVLTLNKGSEVNVIAIQNGLACIIVETDQGTKAGWITLDALSYNDPSATLTPVKAETYKGTPSQADIEFLGLEKCMTLPDPKTYTACYDKMFTTPSVLNVYGLNTTHYSNIVCTLATGSEVNVIAIQNGLACIMFKTSEGEKAGWVSLAALSYNDPSKEVKPTQALYHMGKPGLKDIENLGLQNSMTLPNENSYLATYDKMYIVPGSLKVFSYNESSRSNNICNVVKGTEVNVIAIQNKVACILFETHEGEKAGWIVMEALSYNKPDKELAPVAAKTYSGEPGIQDIERLGLEKSLTLPSQESYISSHEKMFVISNVNVYTFNEKTFSHCCCTLAKGSEVNLIAVQNKIACIMFETDQGTKVGWITLDSLRYNNPLKDSEVISAGNYSGKPGIGDIEKLGVQKSVTPPEDESYISSYQNMYVITSHAPVYSYNTKAYSNVVCSLESGSEVTVIAVQRMFAFILYETDQGTKAGWIGIDSLRFNKPGTPTVTVATQPSGSPGLKDIQACGQELSMTLPKDDSYLYSYESKYISSDKLPVYSYNDPGYSQQCATLAKGSQVVVIAQQGNFACVLFVSDEGQKAGWVSLNGLTDKKPVA